MNDAIRWRMHQERGARTKQLSGPNATLFANIWVFDAAGTEPGRVATHA